jgi:signal recognition particle receptor subunit beta
MVLFKPAKKEFELIFEELMENKKAIAIDIMKLTYQEEHNFLFMNIPTQRMFRNWNEILIHEQDSDTDSD